MKKIVELPPEITINATPQELYGRLLVSSIVLLEPEEATQEGYTTLAPLESGVLVPGAFRLPTNREIDRITDQSAEHRLDLFTLPLGLGRELIDAYNADSTDVYPYAAPRTLAPGLRGSLADVRTDAPNQRTCSVFAGDGRKSGAHIDARRDAHGKLAQDLTLVVANAGPGPRYHGFSPYLTTWLMGSHKAVERNAFIGEARRRGQITDEDAVMCWVELPGPKSDEMAAMTSKAGRTVHDGSTFGINKESTVVLIAEEQL